jgi:hypothetical protein
MHVVRYKHAWKRAKDNEVSSRNLKQKQVVMKMVAALVFNLLLITRPLASEVTHAWTFGDVTNRVGLLGIKDDDGRYRTQILYGPGWNDYWEVDLHIYTFVTTVLFVALGVGCVFCLIYLLRRSKKMGRDTPTKEATKP